MTSQNFTPVYAVPYRICREKLDDVLKVDLDETIKHLLDNPDAVAKPLGFNLKGKYTVRFGGNPRRPSHRLIVKIDNNSKTISFLYLAPRKSVYIIREMWN